MPKSTNQAYARAFGVTLRALRKSRKLSVEKLSKKISVSRSAVSSWECAIASPNWGNLLAVSEALHIKLSTFIQLVEKTADRMKEDNAAATQPAAPTDNPQGESMGASGD